MVRVSMISPTRLTWVEGLCVGAHLHVYVLFIGIKYAV